MDFDFDSDSRTGTRYTGLRDYHLRSALTSSTLSLDKCPEWEIRLRSQLKLFADNFSICDRDPGTILGQIFLESPPLLVQDNTFYYAGKALVTESKVYPSMEVPLLREAGELLKKGNLVTRYYSPSQFLQTAIIIANALNAGKPLPQGIIVSDSDEYLNIVTRRLSSLKLELKISSECFGVLSEDNKLSIHHIDHLKNWSDKCTERFNVEIACIFGHPLNAIIYPPVSLLYGFWSIWDRWLIKLGNDVYKCIKIFESMVIGTILSKNPNTIIKPSHNFLSVTLSEFIESLSSDTSCLAEAVQEMANFLNEQQSMQYLSQFYGLYRIWGHPIVSPQEGIKKVHKIGTTPKTISNALPSYIRRIFLLKYTTWHKASKGQYPVTSLIHSEVNSNITDNEVYNMLTTNASTEQLSKTFNSPYWDNIKVQKSIEIPKTYNLSEMVSDKAISPDRCGLYYMCTKRFGMYDANLKRGVLQWLMRQPESCETFLTRVNDQCLTDNELIIGLYQKEREVNETPRMFALMSHAIRNYIVTTEAMLSEDILPAFPNITMTNSLLSLQKKIYSVSTKQARNISGSRYCTYKDVTIIVNIDFEKWNLNFRRETTYPLFEALGELYGLEHLYNRTYDIFEKSLIYLADGSYKPDTDKSTKQILITPPLTYIGHLGGFEGLRQKGWTLFTDCALELICSKHKCSHLIMGQGDNQVLILTWRTYLLDTELNISELGKRMLTNYFKSFMNDLTVTFSELGLPIKALETWSSENLFLYGKFPTLQGVPLSMSLKKLCRIYYLANEEIMTLDCSLSTIQSNAMAACLADVSSFVPYVIYKLQLLLALKSFNSYHVLLGRGAFDFESGDIWKFTSASGTRLNYSLDRPISRGEFLIFLTWFYKTLGGLNIATWYDFLMRGFPDKVSLALTWLRHLLNVIENKDIKSVLRSIYKGQINPEKNFILLVEDPCSLNLIVPVDARAAVKQAVQELFENLKGVENQEFASLFKFNKEWDKKTFCDKLCEGKILHPRFLHDVAAATLGGYVDSVVSKVSKASTINKLALRSSGRSPGIKIERHEKNYMAYLLWKTECLHSSNIFENCPSQQARSLRIRSWGKILEGVNVPYPLAFLEMQECTGGMVLPKWCDNNYISISLPEMFSSGNLESIHTLGGAPPYLGSETKEKLGADPSRQVFGREPLISRPLKLLRVINWFVPPDSNAQKVVYQLLRALSDLNPEDYVSREMGITGSESHRYRDQALKHGVMSANMYTLGSHMHISTDPWVKYTRGIDNFPINYQAVLCAMQSLIGGHLFHCYKLKIIPLREYHFHESCSECIIPLSDYFHDFDSLDLLNLIPSGFGNSYLWVQEASIAFKYQYDPQLVIQIPEMSYDEYINMKDKRKILTQWIAEDVRIDVEKGASDDFSMRLLSSKDYPRVMYKKLGVRELWEEFANLMIARAGVRYSSRSEYRLTYPNNARELAADDIMKTSADSLLGLAIFYTWPEKFSEIYSYDENMLFPDSNPPSLSSACSATQANLRDVIRKCRLYSETFLIISRINKYPVETIKCYWYRIMCTRTRCCAFCLKIIATIELDESLSIKLNTRCNLGHLTFSGAMRNIKLLTASEDKLLKDSIAYTGLLNRKPVFSQVYKCPTEIELDLSRKSGLDSALLSEIPSTHSYRVWQYSCSLPTISKARIYETLSILTFNLQLVFPTEGVIFGDGLGESSNILSHFYPNTNWIVSSLQDSEYAFPQSYPHVLIPCNPCPDQNVNYQITKSMYNDASSKEFQKNWACVVKGGVCWIEIETKTDRLTIFRNILSLCNWDLCVIRSDFEDYAEMDTIIHYFKCNSESVRVYLTGSLDTVHLECIFILCQVYSGAPRQRNLLKISYEEDYRLAALMLSEATGSVEYAAYLASIEGQSEVVRMLKRCDYWFSLIGVTHLLSCTKLFTPIWWDLQTGKIPENVKHLGINKTYYMYKSDLIALQARLICLALSCIVNPTTLSEEVQGYCNWKLTLKEKSGRILIELRRSKESTYYGIDHENIIKYLQILRKINTLHKRWWGYMPNKIKFHTNTNKPGFWVSNMSQQLPVTLPSLQ